MNGNSRLRWFLRTAVSLMVIVLFTIGQPGTSTIAQSIGKDVLYTTDADFDQGTMVSVNHNPPNTDQLQLDSLIKPFPFINIAASGTGTVVRANTESGEVVGEYRTAPEGRGLNPSRTTVDLFGNVWTANRDEAGWIGDLPHGSTVKIGLIVGGTRVDGAGSPTPDGEYLAPPFGYNTCSDRDGDGLIHTSRGLADVLPWPDVTDGLGGADGLVEDAVDECILLYQRLPDAENARHVSVDADNNVWVAGYPFQQRLFYKLDGTTGAILDSFDSASIGCGGYGGLVDGNGILWSVGGPLLRYDPVSRKGLCIDQFGYGLGIDTNGYVWLSLWDGGIVKIAPDGTVMPGFPKGTYLPEMVASTIETAEAAAFAAALETETVDPVAPAAFHAPSPVPAPQQSLPAAPPEPEPVAPILMAPPALMEEPMENGSVPSFQVSPVHDWLQAASSWTPGATINLVVEDGGAVIFTSSLVADGSGYFQFDLRNTFDFRRGQVVTVTDGTTTKTHTILPLFDDVVNVMADTVSGRGLPNTDVHVWVHGWGGITTTADAVGNWTASFVGQVDLTYFSDGGSSQVDADGDSTGVWWGAQRFTVSPMDDWVSSSETWMPSTPITLTIREGGAVVFTSSTMTDEEGHFDIGFWNEFDLRRGQEVTVSNGVINKTHTVMELYVDVFDPAANTISGRRDPSAAVDVWVHGDGNVTVAPDGSSSWTADFSGLTDLTYFSDGGSQQRDDDGDTTGVWWWGPRIEVSPEDDWVHSWTRWIPEKTVTLTIEDSGAVLYSDSQVTDRNGNFHFGLSGIFDLQRGQVVTVSDGIHTKVHTVMPLFVDDVNVSADTISGRGALSVPVDVWIHGDGGTTVSPDGSGSWTADFSGQTDLTVFSDGGSRQVDADGDSTGVWWSTPRFTVAPDDHWVNSETRWKPGATVILTIEDGGVEVFSQAFDADGSGNFSINLWGRFDPQRGQLVTVSDGTTTKSHTIAPIYIDQVDLAADTISGRGEPGKVLDVWVNGLPNQQVTPDGSGNWIADFSGVSDLTYSSNGGVKQYDDDGDGTFLSWGAPGIEVTPNEDRVQSTGTWSPGATAVLTIEDGGTVVYSDSQALGSAGNFDFNLWNIFDVKRGQVVTVSDGSTSKTHTVTGLYVDQVNVPESTVLGRATAGTKVDVWMHGCCGINVTADPTGSWTADFSSQGTMTYFADGGSRQTDDDGDSTRVWWGAPRLQAAPDGNWVQSWSPWTPGATITMTIAEGGTVVYSDSQAADSNGNFHFSLWEVFDLQRGQTVTVSDGLNTKTLVIANLYVDTINVDSDILSGRANPNSWVDVWIHGDGNLTVPVDSSGNWTADFSGMTDLTARNDGGSQQVDEDADCTAVWWWLPGIEVAPDDEWIGSWNRWNPETTLTITIEVGGAIVYTTTRDTDQYGNFNVNLWDVFDIQRGQVITVTDGTYTQTHTVMDLYIDTVNLSADTISGRGSPDYDLEVWVNGAGSLYIPAEQAANWTADFSGITDLTGRSDGGTHQFDENMNVTSVYWYTPAFQVNPADNTVGNYQRWKPNSLINLTVEEGGSIVFSDAQWADRYGNFNFSVWGVDLEAGHVVTVSDGETTKTHTVMPLQITNIDKDADVVHGTASPHATLWIWVYSWQNGEGRSAIAGADGVWTADFSIPQDGNQAFDITAASFINVNAFDDDGDTTYQRAGAPSLANRGVAVTPVDNHVWVANSGVGTVTRLDSDGNVLKVIRTGPPDEWLEPTGVAVDASGKVWATNMGNSTAVRIDPNAGEDGLGAVDLTVDLGKDAWPYNYSDMTGAVVVGSTSPQGLWSVIQDSQQADFRWGRITWNNEPEGSQPEGTEIIVEARTANTEAGLGGQPFLPVTNGVFFDLTGRYIEVRVTLKAGPDGTSPVLSDIRVQPRTIEVSIDIKPGSYPNSIRCTNKKETITVAILTTPDFNALTVDYTSVTFEGAREFHIIPSTGLPELHVEDVGLDGDLDLVFHFRLKDTRLTCTSTSGTLIGQTVDGIPIKGTDSIRMVR